MPARSLLSAAEEDVQLLVVRQCKQSNRSPPLWICKVMHLHRRHRRWLPLHARARHVAEMPFFSHKHRARCCGVNSVVTWRTKHASIVVWFEWLHAISSINIANCFPQSYHHIVAHFTVVADVAVDVYRLERETLLAHRKPVFAYLHLRWTISWRGRRYAADRAFMRCRVCASLPANAWRNT